MIFLNKRFIKSLDKSFHLQAMSYKTGSGANKTTEVICYMLLIIPFQGELARACLMFSKISS